MARTTIKHILEHEVPAKDIEPIFEAIRDHFPLVTMDTHAFSVSSIPDHAVTYNLLDPNPNAAISVRLPDGRTVVYVSKTAYEVKQEDHHKFELKHFDCGQWRIIAGTSDIDGRLVICLKG